MKSTTTRKIKKIAKTAARRKKDIRREAQHAKSLVHKLQKLGGMTKDTATESLEHAKKNVSALYKKIDKGRLEDVRDEVGDFVTKHPLPVLCLAISSGFLAGWLKKGR